jgi:NADPH2:quinone reductase
MKAAVIHTYGQPPRYDDFPDPIPHDGERIVEVTAAALTNISRSRAAGTHYSDHGTLPAVAGVDGVGRFADGQRVYFGGPREPFGTMSERSLAGRQAFPLPDSLDDVTVAALMNPGVSAWMTLAHRAELRPGERVLIVGATGVTGKLAVQAARLQGAGEIVAAGRNPESLRRAAELGADTTVALDGDPQKRFADIVGDGFDVIVDYLWGAPTEALLAALGRNDLNAASRRTRLVHVGGMAGPSITLLGNILRSTDLVILGNGTGSMNPAQLADSFQRVLDGATRGELTVDTRTVPLAEVESVWNDDGRGTRTVLIP